MSVIRADNVAPSAGGTAKSLVRGVASAWANLNGTGTIALRDSQNVSSVVDEGTGDYRHNLINNMSNTNYCVTACGSFVDGTDNGTGVLISHHRPAGGLAVGSWRMISTYDGNTPGGYYDMGQVASTVMGDLA
jgi:hypothetical protein